MERFVLDEDMPRSTGRLLRELGHEAEDVREHGLRGAADLDVYQFAQQKRAVLFSADRGFGNVLRFPLGEHHGIVIAHFPNHISTEEFNRQVAAQLKQIPEDAFAGNLIVLEPGMIRINSKRGPRRKIILKNL